MKRSRIGISVLGITAGLIVSSLVYSGEIHPAIVPQGEKRAPASVHVGQADAPKLAAGSRPDNAPGPLIDPHTEPHEAGPRDPWMPRPVVPPPGAIEHSGPWTRGPFKSIQVNVDENGNNIVGDAANEPSIAIDPTNPNNIVIGWRQFDSVESDFRQAGYAYSDDAGQTWRFPGVLDPGQFRSDPVLGADAEGIFYYYNIRCAFNGCGDIFRSEDAGRTWAGPYFAVGGDREWMTVDATDGPGSGHVYASWGSSFVRSVDGGLSFEGPFPVSAYRGHTAIGLESAVYVVRQTDNSGSTVSRSLDARDPDQTPSFEALSQAQMGGVHGGHAGPNPGGNVGTPWIAVDLSDKEGRGNVYILGSIDPPGPDPLEIMFVRSEDEGRTWSEPLRVNDDDLESNAWQWFGTMSVAPNGRIDAVWNDTRNTGEVQRSETFYAYSNDGGMTWSRNTPISPEWNSHIGWPNQNKIGDYYHMVSDDAAANLAYATTLNGEQDVYFLRIGDCNLNGIHDGVDIAEHRSADANANGIPDECECVRKPAWQCDGDTDGDGQVNPVDSGLVQAAFGSTDEADLCQYDMDCDGQINPVDSGIVQSLFGTCDPPRDVCP